MKKRLILIMIILVIPLSSCKVEVEPQVPQTEKLDIKIIYPTYSKAILSDEIVSNWRKHIQELTYNRVDINLNYIDRFSIIKENFTNENAIVFVDSYEILNYLIEEDLIIPMNDYLSIIQNIFPNTSDALNNVTDMKGNIWAIPTNDSQSASYREYDEEILNEFQIVLPQNIQDLYDFCYALVSYNNGENKKYFSRYNIDTLTKDFKDIFNSFGCYFYTPYYDINTYSFGYNPHTREFQDYVNTDEFKEAIQFIKFLKDNDLITTYGVSQDYIVTGYPVFINNNQNNESIQNVNNVTNKSILKNLNNSAYTEINTSKSSFAILRSKENIESTIEWITYDLYAFDELIYAFRYGIKNEQYKIIGGDPIPIINKNGKFNQIMMNIDLYNNPINMESNHYSLGIFKEFENKQTMAKNMHILFDEILNKDVSIDEAIANYNANSIDLHIEEYLFSLNNQ